uniref:Protein phosphatase 1 regulatory subunit 12B n=1 Tax=Pan troglodytes TaxID=9598 RepID=G2HEY8_PANTR|nr:protein phosphatase 1 regulatory subunit 12B [Pan troglodytes]
MRMKKQIWMSSPLRGCPSERGGGPRNDEEAQASISGQRMRMKLMALKRSKKCGRLHVRIDLLVASHLLE